MSEPIAEITHRLEFAAAHRLESPDLSEAENRALFGPCFGLHGHNYQVEVTVKGPVPARSGMVMNLVGLRALMLSEIFEPCDHGFLNDAPLMAGRISTAENLAIAIWEKLAPMVSEQGTSRISRVRIFESSNGYADYYGPDSQ